jgi:hypothetical protein
MMLPNESGFISKSSLIQDVAQSGFVTFWDSIAVTGHLHVLHRVLEEQRPQVHHSRTLKSRMDLTSFVD